MYIIFIRCDIKYTSQFSKILSTYNKNLIIKRNISPSYRNTHCNPTHKKQKYLNKCYLNSSFPSTHQNQMMTYITFGAQSCVHCLFLALTESN